jgi:hypothetical protein
MNITIEHRVSDIKDCIMMIKLFTDLKDKYEYDDLTEKMEADELEEQKKAWKKQKAVRVKKAKVDKNNITDDK